METYFLYRLNVYTFNQASIQKYNSMLSNQFPIANSEVTVKLLKSLLKFMQIQLKS